MSDNELDAGEENVSGENKPNSRRNFIKNILLGAAGAAVGSSVLESCKKADVSTSSTTETITGTDYEGPGTVGDFGVFYDRPPQMTGANLAAARQMSSVIVQPGFITNAQARTMGIKGKAYASGFAVNPGDAGTINLVNTLNTIDNTPGPNFHKAYLRDAAGVILSSPGNGTFADLRTPAVYDAFKSYIIGLGTTYEKGVVFDSPDQAVYYEDLNPTLYTGIVDKLGQLYVDVSNSIYNKQKNDYIAAGTPQTQWKFPQGVQAFSGIQPTGASNIALSDKMLKAEARGNCSIILESRTFFRSGEPTDPAYRAIVKAQIVKFAQFSKAEGRNYIILDMLEPTGTAPGAAGYQAAAVETAKFANEIRTAIESSIPGFKAQIRIGIADVFRNTNTPDNGLFDFANPNFAPQNRALKNFAPVQNLGYVMNDKPHFQKLLDTQQAQDKSSYIV